VAEEREHAHFVLSGSLVRKLSNRAVFLSKKKILLAVVTIYFSLNF
jgi:hypothetical protein